MTNNKRVVRIERERERERTREREREREERGEQLIDVLYGWRDR